MIHFNTTLFHYFFQVTVRYAITDIEKNSVKNDIFWKMGAFKTNHWFFNC